MALAYKLTDEVETIDKLETDYDVFRYLKKMATDHGLKKFSVMTISRQDDMLGEIAVVNNWDPELIHVYDENSLAAKSPILGHFRTSSRPMQVDISTMKQERPSAEQGLTRELFSDFGMCHSLSYPVANCDGQRGGITYSGGEIDLPEEDILSLHLLSMYAFDRLSIAANGVDSAAPSLSAREKDCMTWTAAGKTSAEIAMILGLSDHTVNHYLTAACKKLDSVNRVQAVAKAIRLGLLE